MVVRATNVGCKVSSRSDWTDEEGAGAALRVAPDVAWPFWQVASIALRGRCPSEPDRTDEAAGLPDPAGARRAESRERERAETWRILQQVTSPAIRRAMWRQENTWPIELRQVARGSEGGSWAH